MIKSTLVPLIILIILIQLNNWGRPSIKRALEHQ